MAEVVFRFEVLSIAFSVLVHSLAVVVIQLKTVFDLDIVFASVANPYIFTSLGLSLLLVKSLDHLHSGLNRAVLAKDEQADSTVVLSLEKAEFFPALRALLRS